MTTPTRLLVLGLPVLLSACYQPPPYRLDPVSYGPVLVLPPRETSVPPAYAAPTYAPIVAAPLPPDPVLTEPPPEPVVTAPLPPAPDAPRDAVEDMLLKPMGSDAPAPVPTPEKVATPAAADGNAAVPMMGFRPMRGQRAAP